MRKPLYEPASQHQTAPAACPHTAYPPARGNSQAHWSASSVGLLVFEQVAWEIDYCTLLAFPFELRGLFDESRIRQRRHGRLPPAGKASAALHPVRVVRPLTRFRDGVERLRLEGARVRVGKKSCNGWEDVL